MAGLSHRPASSSFLSFRRKEVSLVFVWFVVVLLSLSCCFDIAGAYSTNDDGGVNSSGSDDQSHVEQEGGENIIEDGVIEVDDGSSSSSREVVKCVCDGSCEHLRAEECRHGVTFDMCRCCLVCARGENEPCGGARGTCAFGLHCQLNDEQHTIALTDINSTTATPLLSQEGTCSRVGRCGQLQDQYGCVVDPEGLCVCLTRRACPGEKMFLFEDENSCRSRMAFLIAKKDLEPATSSSLTQDGMHPATGQPTPDSEGIVLQQSVQALMSDLGLHYKIVMLEETVRKLQEENQDLTMQVKQLEVKAKEGEDVKKKLDAVLSRFTPGIQDRLLNPGKKRGQWTTEDIIAGVKLHNISIKAYTHVRDNLLPLPCLSQIQSHLGKLILQPEKPIQSVFNLINANFVEEVYHSQKTLCVLALDEMSIDARYAYDPALDQVVGGMKNVTLFCARGLLSSWKQPLLYSYNGTQDNIIELITLLYENGLKVVGVVSDMGPKKVKIWRQLGIAKVYKGIINTTSFPHPIQSKERVYWLTDFPHLLKRLRDHLLDSSIQLPGGAVVDRSWIQELVLRQKSELQLTFKLGLKNLYLHGQQRQNCSTAYQLFSHTVATAIRLIMKDKDGYEEVADFFDLTNDLSDLFNSRLATDNNNKFKAAYGMYLEEQEELLNKFETLLMNSRIGKRKTKAYAPFQKGFLMLIKSTRELFEDLRSAIPGMKYLMLSHLNQDFLENVFSLIRGFGGFNANPNGVQFKYRLRKLVLSWNLGNKGGLEVDYETLVKDISSNFVPTAFCDVASATEGYLEEIEQQLLYVDPTVDAVKDYNVEEMSTDAIVTEGAQEYIAGYISSKFRNEHPEMSADLVEEEKRNLWISSLSKGGLVEPSSIWFMYFQKFEDFFRVINPPTSISMEAGIMKTLYNLLLERFPEVPQIVVKFYSRCRIYIRIKYLNKLLQDTKYQREHQRHLSLLAGSEEDTEEEIGELSISGEQLLEDIFK